MATSTSQYNPDYAVLLDGCWRSHIAALGLSHVEFAERCGFSPEVVSEIVVGEGLIDPEIADVLGRETGLNQVVWLNLEAAYRDKLAELSENEALAEWAKKFPAKELVKRGDLSESSLQGDRMARMLSFFDVWSADALQDKYGETSIANRHSPSFKSSRPELATWLRLGEIEAERTECPEYEMEAFLGSLQDIRSLTASDVHGALEEARNLCLQAGVVLLFIQPVKKVALSGASWWLSTGKPIIQLSARHMSDDHVWFSLFHEAAHILLHSKKQVFIDAIRSKADCNVVEESKAESEADAWARNFLVPLSDWEQFAGAFLGSADEVRHFAAEQGIAPGIIVGRLQHEGILEWTRLNSLKRKLAWTEP